MTRKEQKMESKAQWIDRLCATKRTMGYTENEVAAYRVQMANKYNVTEAQFRAARKERTR